MFKLLNPSQLFQAAPAQASNEPPYLFKLLAKTLAVISGIFAILFGAVDVFLSVFSFQCIVAGVSLLIEGLLLILIEAPFIGGFFELPDYASRFFENKSIWWKPTIYLCFSGIPLSFCKSASIFFPCLLIFFTSGLFLVLGLGRKASADEMAQKVLSESPESVLVNNEVQPATSPPFYKQAAAASTTAPNAVNVY